MKKIMLVSLNFLPTELKIEYNFIQDILQEEGSAQIIPNTFEEQINFSNLIRAKDKKAVQRFITKNNIKNIIVSSLYYEDRASNEEYYDLMLKEMNMNVLFTFHSNGKSLEEFQERISKKYPDSPSLFLFKYTTPRTKEFFKVVNEYFEIS